MEQGKSNEFSRGVIVFVVLAVLTAIEYILGTSLAPTVFLWIIGLSKAALVIWFFMHVFRVFRSEGGH